MVDVHVVNYKTGEHSPAKINLLCSSGWEKSSVAVEM